MIRRASRVPRALLLVLICAWMTAGAMGCTKTVHSSIDDFGSDKTMVVKFRDGEVLKGEINLGKAVSFTTFGKIYRAKIEGFDENGNITLGRAFVQEEYDQFALQRQRLEHSTLHIDDQTERMVLPAYKIVSVEEVRFDRTRSGRAAGFWVFTVAVLAGILNARL